MVKQTSALLTSGATLKKSNVFISYIDNKKPLPSTTEEKANSSGGAEERSGGRSVSSSSSSNQTVQPTKTVNTVKQVFSATPNATTTNKSQVSTSFLNKNRIFISNCKQNGGQTGITVTAAANPVVNEPKTTTGGELVSSTSSSPSLQSFNSSASYSTSSSASSSAASSYSKLALSTSNHSTAVKVAAVGSIFKLNNPFLSNCKKHII
jgi:hypothetical protein